MIKKLTSKSCSSIRRLRGFSTKTATTSEMLKRCSAPIDEFSRRHIGPNEADTRFMLNTIGLNSCEELIDQTIPTEIRLQKALQLPFPLSESEALEKLKGIASKNKVLKSFIGMGYHDCILPGVIQRNMLESPDWYTAYTPYQAEISQGRLESLLNFQTMVSDLTGLPVANASLLDEGTAAAEAMSLCYGAHNGKRKKFAVAPDCHPQTISVIQTRAIGYGIEIVIAKDTDVEFSGKEFCGMLIQYPNTFGEVNCYEELSTRMRDTGTLLVAATDLLSLTLLKPPGEFGVDIAVGSAQRFGVPMMFGGPHAAFMATSMKYQRKIPGRIIGVSKDSDGNPALRMALQTREQHIRRDKATSNICTAQALLANIAASYAVYHGPQGLRDIAVRLHELACICAVGLKQTTKCNVLSTRFFDTLHVDVSGSGLTANDILARTIQKGLNIRVIDDYHIGISFGESATIDDVEKILLCCGSSNYAGHFEDIVTDAEFASKSSIPENLLRLSPYMSHPVFNTHHSETEMLRYLKYLEDKDLSLNTSMISLGSCTMKLNATSELSPISWPEFAKIHPFAPRDQTNGYLELITSLHSALSKITGFSAISSQPNSGAQGEYAGLLSIKRFHESNGESHRNVCLIPISAHGTNPASAAMCGMKVVVVKSDDNGNIDFEDLRDKAKKHGDDLCALMLTYPSTYGVFEEGVKDICSLIHSYGGQVYLDGANLNAQIGMCNPASIGADVCHMNLHKTFAIPHGGGGPGVGSIGVAEHLSPFLPGNPEVPTGGEGKGTVTKRDLSVSSAPFGSAGILPISWMYIHMLGEEGLKKATSHAILHANYMSKRLCDHYDVVFTGKGGRCAHEFIIDIRPFKKHGIVEEDVAKRLQDYGFHSPTMSWPVSGTLMIEPTESENLAEMDRFCDALILIREEIASIESGKINVDDSPLKHAPHTAAIVCSSNWDRKYSRETAAFPAPWHRNGRNKRFWPTVGRVDNVHGDRNLICSCPPIELYDE